MKKVLSIEWLTIEHILGMKRDELMHRCVNVALFQSSFTDLINAESVWSSLKQFCVEPKACSICTICVFEEIFSNDVN